MKTYYLTFTITDPGIEPRTEYLEVQAPDILTASRMGDIYVKGYAQGSGHCDIIECNKVSLFPSRKPRT